MQARRTWFSDRDVNNLAAAHHEVQRLRDALRQTSRPRERLRRG
jgi:hypothetical protein